MRMRDGGLAGAGIAGEAHVQRGRLGLQAQARCAARSTSSSAAISRMRVLTGSRPTSSWSSRSSIARRCPSRVGAVRDRSAPRHRRPRCRSCSAPALAVARAGRPVRRRRPARCSACGGRRLRCARSPKPGSSAGRLTMNDIRSVSKPWLESKAMTLDVVLGVCLAAGRDLHQHAGRRP